MSNLASSLIEHKRIKTTHEKALELRKFIEPMIKVDRVEWICDSPDKVEHAPSSYSTVNQKFINYDDTIVGIISNQNKNIEQSVNC